MCLAIPGKVVDVEKGFATVDYSGEKRKISTELINVKKGDYVIVQAKFAIQKIPKKEALEAIRIWQRSTKRNK